MRVPGGRWADGFRDDLHEVIIGPTHLRRNQPHALARERVAKPPYAPGGVTGLLKAAATDLVSDLAKRSLLKLRNI